MLRTAISTSSVFPSECEIAEFFEKKLREYGFEVQRQYLDDGERYNILAERGKGEKSLLFYGHMDTVKPHGSWKTNPFQLAMEGDRAYGLGAFDMKGGTVSILQAAENAWQSGTKIKILLCADEENLSEGMNAAIKTNWLDDIAAAIFAEPGSSYQAHAGARMLTLGRRGRCVYVLDIRGKSVHGARAQEGVNAIEEAAKLICNLEKLPLTSHNKLPRESAFVSLVHGSTESLSIPDSACIEIDFHMVPPHSAESTKERIAKWVGQLKQDGKINKNVEIGIRMKEKKTPYSDPYITDENDKFVGFVADKIKRNFGKAVINYGLSVGDENVLRRKLNVPIVTIGPAGGNAHAADEWVSLRSMEEVAHLFTSVINDFNNFCKE